MIAQHYRHACVDLSLSLSLSRIHSLSFPRNTRLMRSSAVLGLNTGKQMLVVTPQGVKGRGVVSSGHLPPSSVSVFSLSVEFRSNRKGRFPSISVFPFARSPQTSVSVKMTNIEPEIAAEDVDVFVGIGNQVADAAGEVIRKYFRQSFEISDKDDLSPVTIADGAAEESMSSLILQNFPSHAIYGEENGWRCRENSTEYVWVLDPIDGTKSFITGKPLFGTLISLLHKGKPILGIIDQPILRERWVGVKGRRTTLNGSIVSTRSCGIISHAYLYTTSPHLFGPDEEKAFIRVRDKVKVPLYGCDCYAYALLSSGFVDLVVESGLKPYDILPLLPVIEGAGGVITDWRGHSLLWEASPESTPKSFDVVASGDPKLHKQVLDLLQWE